MSILDNIPNFLSSPGSEELLSAIPTLFGAFEEGRGRPMGNVLGALGGLLQQHADYRREGQTAQGLQSFVKNSLIPGSLASTEFQQFQPLQNKLPYDTQIALLQNILGESQSEAAKKPTNYLNTDTFQWEPHDTSEFKGGPIPANLVPAGEAATKLFEQHKGISTGNNQTQQLWDVIGKAKFGKPFNQLDPQQQLQVVTDKSTLGAQGRADIQYQNFEREQQTRQTDALAKMAQSNADALTRSMALLNARTTNEPHGPEEEFIYDHYGVSPEQLHGMPQDKRQQLMDRADHDKALIDASKAGESASARATAAAQSAKARFMNKSVGDTKFFTVNPDFSKTGDVMSTVAESTKKGYKFVQNTDENSYSAALEARDSLKSLQDAGKKLLPNNQDWRVKSKVWNQYSAEAAIKGKALINDVDASNYLTAMLHLIPLLRTATKTSRPNQQEINRVIVNFQKISTQEQLNGAINQGNMLINSALRSMTGNGASGVKLDLNSKTSAAADAAYTGSISAPSDAEGGVHDTLSW